MNHTLEDFPLTLAAGITFTALMGLSSLLFFVITRRKQVRQKEFIRYLEGSLEASIRSQEAEAQRIAADLHEDIGSLLSATRMSFSLVTRYLDNCPESLQSAEQTKRLLEEAVKNVRRITKEIQPPALEKLGLVVVLQELVEKVQHAHPEVLIDLECRGEEYRLDRSVEFILFRVAQELLQNSLKHADASRIELLLLYQPKRVFFTLSDNGMGFDWPKVQQQTTPLGLKNIESRLSVVGGHVVFETSPGQGTHTVVDIPLHTS